jgi:copper transport protein
MGSCGAGDRVVFQACPWPLRRGAVVALALVCGLAVGRNAGAHALLQHSTPESGAVLRRAPEAVTLAFSEQPEPGLSVVHVLDRLGRPVEHAPAQPVPGRPSELTVPPGVLPNGVYTVTWRTVSRLDGHVAGGTFGFGVGVAPLTPPSPQGVNPPPSPLDVLSRLFLHVGLSGLLGAAMVWTLAPRLPHIGVPAYLWGLWTAAAFGLVALGVAQAADAGVEISRLLRTSLGHALWWRAAPIAAAGLAIGIGQASERHWRKALMALGLLGGAAMLAHVIAGHAGAGSGLWRRWNILQQWGHFAGIGVWVGALAAVVLTARSRPHDATAVRRFSLGAAIALGAVAITGALRAVDEVGWSWPTLLSTEVGKLVLLKAALLALLALGGAAGRHLFVPRVPANLRGLHGLVAAQLSIAAGALAVTAILTGLALPSAMPVAGMAAPAISVAGNDYATSVRVRLTVTPGRTGINWFSVGITDYDTQRSVTADRVTLRFTKPDRPDIGASGLSLSRAADGTYQGQGANLALDGRWSVAVIVERQNRSTEVPLSLTTKSEPPTVRTVQVPGKPVLYNIDLSGGRMLSIYLDPGKAGYNTLHGTFIDERGRELELARAPEITLSRPGEIPRSRPALREGPGHFLSDADLGPGEWHLEIVATTRAGEVLRARLTVHL